MYQRPRIMSSSLPPRQKYDYLIEDKTKLQSNSRNLDQIKIRQRQQKLKSQAQYELIIEFELRRQKQKTSILQQRLRNKQSFIKQMKQFQDQLTLTYQKCQQQLLYYKKQCQNYESKFQSFGTFNNNNALLNTLNNNNITLQHLQTFQPYATNQQQQLVREYLEQIAELKHLIIRQQEEISFYQKKQKQRNKQIFSSSVYKDFGGKQMRMSKKGKQNEQSPFKKLNQKKSYADKEKRSKNQQRSKTLANQFLNEKQDKNFCNLTKIQACILKEPHKIISFINHFLTMCQFFQQKLNQQQIPLKQKLKKAWKWIKNVVVQWNHLKNQKLQKIKEYKIGNFAMKYLKPTLSTIQIQDILQKALKGYLSSKH